MKILQSIIICSAILYKCRSAKNGDEGRPYEFGFTIDGEQHRYEKRDANGIIQGEFGFITADGIYHVTTYATDENGSFRILSMRNVRISDPLDGSGGTYANKVPASSVQGAGKIPQKQQIQHQPQQQLQQQPQQKPQQKPQPLQQQQLQQPPIPVNQNQLPPSTTFISPNAVSQEIRTTTKRTPFTFTTQSTIKPACAGCGYVTYAPSTKKPVIQPIPQPVGVNKPHDNQFPQTPSTQFNQPPAAFSPATAPPFAPVSSVTTTAAYNQNNGYKPGVFAPSLNQQPQQPPTILQQTQPLPISQSNLAVQVNNHSTSVQIPSGPSQFVAPVEPPQSFPVRPSQSFSPAFGLSQSLTPVGPSQVSPPGASQSFPPDKPSQNLPFAPQQASDLVGPSQSLPSPLQPIGPSQVSPTGPSLSFPLDRPSQTSPIGPPQSPSPEAVSQSLPQAPSQFIEPPSFSSHQPQSPQNVDVFNAVSESTPLLPNVQNDTIQLPVNTFARPPINNQAEFDAKLPSAVPKKLAPSRASDIKVENGMIFVPNNPPIKIQDKYPGMVDGLPEGIEERDIVDLLYKFNYTIGFHGHYEKGLRNGTKIGGYFVNGRDGISRVVTYVADELGYRPKFRLINLGLDSPHTPKEATEKNFGLKSFEFVWYPLK